MNHSSLENNPIDKFELINTLNSQSIDGANFDCGYKFNCLLENINDIEIEKIDTSDFKKFEMILSLKHGSVIMDNGEDGILGLGFPSFSQLLTVSKNYFIYQLKNDVSVAKWSKIQMLLWDSYYHSNTYIDLLIHDSMIDSFLNATIYLKNNKKFAQFKIDDIFLDIKQMEALAARELIIAHNIFTSNNPVIQYLNMRNKNFNEAVKLHDNLIKVIFADFENRIINKKEFINIQYKVYGLPILEPYRVNPEMHLDYIDIIFDVNLKIELVNFYQINNFENILHPLLKSEMSFYDKSTGLMCFKSFNKDACINI
ncbi:MAG: hypothetical protein HRU38_02215 [Saccharospirillaceae bacterium]|nr:hypothetical protein [Pseudomonadales bacterium]NRB77474.1 hypothetical protein [Saccharospirillaceae bacterium]